MPHRAFHSPDAAAVQQEFVQGDRLISKRISKRPASSSSLSPSYLSPTMSAYDQEQDEVLSRLDAMTRQEEQHYGCTRYDLLPASPCAQAGQLEDFSNEPTDADCRRKMCDWTYAVVQHCNFSPSNVVIAMSTIDRYLSTPRGAKALADRRYFQLVCMTSIYLSIKINEVETITPRGMAKVSRDDYTQDEIVACELDILDALDWHINPPTPISFAEQYIALLRPEPSKYYNNEEQEEECQALHENVKAYVKMQVEMASREYHFVGTKASSIAFAATLNALSCTKAEGVVNNINFDLLAQRLHGKIRFSQDINAVEIQTLGEELLLLFPSSAAQDPSSPYLEDDEEEDGLKNSFDSSTSVDDVTKADALAPAALSPRCVIVKDLEEAPWHLQNNKHILGKLLCNILEPFGLIQNDD